MRPSSLGGGRIMRRTLSVRLSVCLSVDLSVCLSVCLSVRPVIVTERHVAPPSELQWHTCTFRHALRAVYRTAISAAQILVIRSTAAKQSSMAVWMLAHAVTHILTYNTNRPTKTPKRFHCSWQGEEKSIYRINTSISTLNHTFNYNQNKQQPHFDIDSK